MENSLATREPIFNPEVIKNSLKASISEIRKTQEKIRDQNPFIEVIDKETLKEAKKRKRNLLKGRTEVTNQDQVIGSTFSNIRKGIIDETKLLIDITQPLEQEIDESIKGYEEKERLEKAAAAAEKAARLTALEDKVNEFIGGWKEVMNTATIKTIYSIAEDYSTALEGINSAIFKEKKLFFEVKAEELHEGMLDRKTFLQKEENNRIEEQRLKVESEKLAEQKRIEEAKLKEEREKLAKEKAEFAKEQAAVKRKEEEKERKLQEEKEAEEQAKLEAKNEALRIKKDEESRKRFEALKPEKEKIVVYLKSLVFTSQRPDIQDKQLDAYLTSIEEIIIKNRESAITRLTKR